jgi:LmbE family N-acetylglucosaminyl deacetylase
MSRKYRALIISPHLDDAVFSCGGLIANLLAEGPILVINIFTGYLADMKTRGVVLGDERYKEETDAAHFLGYESHNLGELDASFRRPAYQKLGNIFKPPVHEDTEWLPRLREKIFKIISPLDFHEIYIPLGVGWHVDHILTYLIFETYSEPNKLVYYEEVPYCTIPHATRHRLNQLAHHSEKINEFKAWVQTTTAYSQTAMMRNLKPWIVRFFATPVVGFYFYRLIGLQKKTILPETRRKLKPFTINIAKNFNRKITAMALYRSQFKEFFSSEEDCAKTLAQPTERFWKKI